MDIIKVKTSQINDYHIILCHIIFSAVFIAKMIKLHNLTTICYSCAMTYDTCIRRNIKRMWLFFQLSHTFLILIE